MPKKTPKTKSPVRPAETQAKSTVELSDQQLDQVAGGLVIRERIKPPVE